MSGTSEDIFIEGNDAAAWDIPYNPATGTFSGSTSLGGTITADPGAVANAALTRTDVFVRGSDNGLYQKSRVSGTWGQWVGRGGRLITGPDASTRTGGGPPTDIVDVWVGGTDGQLYHMWSPDGGVTFYPWEALGGFVTSDPRAVSWNWSRVDVFVRGTDYALYHKWWFGTGWSDWERLGGTLTSAPDVASCSSGHLDVFVRGTDNGIYTKWWDGAAWSAWTALGGTWTSSVSAVCRPGGGGIIDLFMKGTDNTVWTFNTGAH
jgi:hypothetical protein